jgi:hypothetical protein
MWCTLHLCWLWLQRVDPTKPWVALPLHEDDVTRAYFKSSIHCIVSDGRSMLFWLDPWVDGCCIMDLALDLLAVVHPRRCNNKTVVSTLAQNAWLRDIVRALTLSVLMQYVHVRERLDAFALDPSSPNNLVWCWCSSSVYSASSTYKAMFHGQSELLGARYL